MSVNVYILDDNECISKQAYLKKGEDKYWRPKQVLKQVSGLLQMIYYYYQLYSKFYLHRLSILKLKLIVKMFLNRPTLKRENTSIAGSKGKRPAWDLKGRLEDMEKMFEMTNKRIVDLETEKQTLQSDVETKKEVVVQSSEEIKNLRSNIEKSDHELETARKTFQEKENQLREQISQLKRELDEEQFSKSSLERKLKGLEDEIASRLTEIAGLKKSVAELSSSRAGIEAELASNTFIYQLSTHLIFF